MLVEEHKSNPALPAVARGREERPDCLGMGEILELPELEGLMFGRQTL